MNNSTSIVAFVEYSSVVEVANHHHLEEVEKTHLFHNKNPCNYSRKATTSFELAVTVGQNPSLEVAIVTSPRSSLIPTPIQL